MNYTMFTPLLNHLFFACQRFKPNHLSRMEAKMKANTWSSMWKYDHEAKPPKTESLLQIQT